jgi:membrane protease YdiL (CAAX protease family)
LFATAVLFGWVHARVWPSPVPLLWLGLGLGWLAWRGRSIAGCVVLHAVFNGIACVILLLSPDGKG